MSKNYLNQDIDSKRIKNILKLLVHLTRVKYVSPEFYQEGIEIIFPYASKDSPPTFITPEHLMSIEIDEPVKYYHGGRFFSFIPSAMFKTYTNDEFNLNKDETNLLWELYTEAIEKKIKEVYFDFKNNENISKEINEMKYLFGYKPGKVISEQKNIKEGLFDFFKSKEDDEKERFSCQDCGEYDYKMYMVNDDLWNQYGNDELTLCKSCFEKRMGRNLEKDDFEDYKDTLVNKQNTEIQNLY